jgi:hypothetical protein
MDAEHGTLSAALGFAKREAPAMRCDDVRTSSGSSWIADARRRTAMVALRIVGPECGRQCANDSSFSA